MAQGTVTTSCIGRRRRGAKPSRPDRILLGTLGSAWRTDRVSQDLVDVLG